MISLKTKTKTALVQLVDFFEMYFDSKEYGWDVAMEKCRNFLQIFIHEYNLNAPIGYVKDYNYGVVLYHTSSEKDVDEVVESLMSNVVHLGKFWYNYAGAATYFGNEKFFIDQRRAPVKAIKVCLDKNAKVREVGNMEYMTKSLESYRGEIDEEDF